MTLFEIVILTGILTAFCTFGVVLAWAEYQTRHLPRPPSKAAEPAIRDDEHWKAAA